MIYVGLWGQKMGRYNTHPAQGGGHYHDVKVYKNRGKNISSDQRTKAIEEIEKETQERELI